MIIGIGVDLVNVPRFAELLARRRQRVLSRFFTAQEAARADSSRSAAESFAARFAAKEAFFKALGTGWGPGGSWKDVEVVSADSGDPSLRLAGRAAAYARERGITHIHLSLTHTDDNAAAFVILEG